MTSRTNRMAMLAFSSAAALSLAACGGDGAAKGEAGATTPAKLEQIAPPAGKKWQEVVSRTPEGNYVMGNPDAKVKLIEYGSLTCSHCADFSKASTELENNYVASGQVAFEFRNYLLNGLDLPIAMLTRCSGPERFFPLTANVFASQEEIFKAAQSADQAALEKTQSLPANQRPAAIAKAIGLDKFFKARGMTDAEINQCLADTKDITALTKNVEEANTKYKLTGTPTFIIGSEARSLGWPEVKQWLDESL